MTRNYAKRKASEFNKFREYFQKLWMYFLAVPLFWLFYKFEIQGRENIPKGARFIVAANHISHFDPFMVSLAVQKPVAYMAKKELFEGSKLFVMCMDYLGAFAVNREKLEVSTIKTVKEVFKSDWMLGIFPQGGIKRDRKIQKINKGFAVIAKAAKWDILPISITGCEEYNWIPFKAKVIIKIGTPISHELSQNDLIRTWGDQVAKMCGYEHTFIESENSEDQDQKAFADA